MFRIIILIVLVCFTGCVSSKIEYVEPEKIPANKTYRISLLNLKNGTQIDVKDKEAKFILKHKGVNNVIVYYEDVNIEKTVPLKDVSWLKIEILESNQIVTAIAVIGITAAVLLIAVLVAFGLGGFQMH
ncbi:MAG: hypothetical protein ABI543_14115 [Ignavibacteria bacterium]